MASPAVEEPEVSEGEEPEVEVKFRRDLTLRDIVMIGLGPTIGTTIFTLMGPGREIAGTGLLLVLVLNFIVTIFTAMAYMELASVVPETGGGYLWVKTAFSPRLGFLAGWLSWFGHSIVCAFYVLSFGLFTVFFARPWLGSWPYQDWLVKGLSLAVLFIFLAVNYRGTRSTGKSSTFVTLVLVGVVGVFVVAGLVWFALHPAANANLTPFFPAGGFDPSIRVLMAMGLTFVVFEGYEIIAQTGEEVRDPEKNVPRAQWITLSISTTLFILVGFVSIVALPLSDPDAGSPFAVLHAAREFFGSELGIGVIVFGVALGSLTSVNSLVFSSSRVAFAMGRDGAMPQAFGRLHPVRRTPVVSLIVSGSLIAIMIAGFDLLQIAASADLMFLLLFTMVNAAAIQLRRKRPDLPRSYVTPLFPLIPILGLSTKAVLAVSLYLVNPLAWFIGAAWVALGIGAYYVWTRREQIAEAAGPFVEAFVPVPKERYHLLVAAEDANDTPLVEFASVIARVEDADMTVLNVVEAPATLPVKAIGATYVQEVRLRLGRLTRVATTLGVRAKGRVVVSHEVSDAVLETIKDESVNLLVAGWKGAWRGGRILGTNIDKLVQYAPCDVVVFKTSGLRPQVEKILVFNAPAWHVSYATGYAILLAIKHSAKIVIYTAATTDEEMATEKVYSERLAQMCKTHGVAYEEKFAKVRNIVDAVVEEAKGYDLLAVGASDEWVKLEYAFGSVQDQIARRAPCPVLMVRKVRKPTETAL